MNSIIIMENQRSDEERAVVTFIEFANEKKCNYQVEASYHPSKEPKKAVQLRLYSGYEGSNVVFNHCITSTPMGKMLDEQTLEVGRGVHQRKTYLDFIEFVKEKSGIQLHNGFEQLWKDHPERYSLD